MKRNSKLKLAIPSESSSETIGFRFKGEPRRILDERAVIFDCGPHEYARQLVMEKLMEGDERQQLIDAVSALRSQVVELRQEFAHAVQVILVSAGKISAEQSEAWVQANFNQPLP